MLTEAMRDETCDGVWLTVKEASSLYKVKESTLYVWAERAFVPHYKVGKLLRFKKDELDTWFSSHRVAPVDPEERGRAALEYARLNRYNSHQGKPGEASERRRDGAL